MNIGQQKKIAAEKAVEEIKSGMIVGLGTGSTVQFALEKISEKLKNRELKNIVCIPSSKRTEEEARKLNIPLTTLNEECRKQNAVIGNQKSEVRSQKSDIEYPASSIQNPESSIIDLTIDGADEFAVGKSELAEVAKGNPERSEGDSIINLIKGGGGALLREKIVAQASKRLIIIADESKRSKYLGEKWPVPIEVIQMALEVEKKFLENIGAVTKVRKISNGSYYLTDEGNFIIDANFGIIREPGELAQKLNNRAGIVEHGIFVGLADKVICAMQDRTIKEFGNQK